jgi:hypothetical protein
MAILTDKPMATIPMVTIPTDKPIARLVND